MAHTSTVTLVRRPGRPGDLVIQVAETEVSATSIAFTDAEGDGIDIGFTHFRITHVICSLRSGGSAATVNPLISRNADPDVANGEIDVLYDHDSAGDPVNAAPAGGNGVTCYSPTGKIYPQARANAGSDNTVDWELHITEGWGPGAHTDRP